MCFVVLYCFVCLCFVVFCFCCFRAGDIVVVQLKKEYVSYTRIVLTTARFDVNGVSFSK